MKHHRVWPIVPVFVAVAVKANIDRALLWVIRHRRDKGCPLELRRIHAYTHMCSFCLTYFFQLTATTTIPIVAAVSQPLFNGDSAIISVFRTLSKSTNFPSPFNSLFRACYELFSVARDPSRVKMRGGRRSERGASLSGLRALATRPTKQFNANWGSQQEKSS